jgi:hypothetical protein
MAITNLTTARHRRVATAASLAVSALFLTGCAADGEPADVDVTDVQETVEEGMSAGVDQAKEAASAVTAAIEGSSLDEDAKAAAEDATTEAADAIDKAKAALDDPDTQETVDEAKQALADAGAKVDEVAADADGALKTALEALSDQMSQLDDQLGTD